MVNFYPFGLEWTTDEKTTPEIGMVSEFTDSSNTFSLIGFNTFKNKNYQ